MLGLLWKEEKGQDLTEYAFFLLLIVLAGVAAMNSLAAAVSATFSNAASDLTTS
jgi:Flp pilus assembly pilin Flp